MEISSHARYYIGQILDQSRQITILVNKDLEMMVGGITVKLFFDSKLAQNQNIIDNMVPNHVGNAI